jgi:hypothetical protein
MPYILFGRKRRKSRGGCVNGSKCRGSMCPIHTRKRRSSKGSRSITRPGRKDYMTHKGSEFDDEDGHYLKPYKSRRRRKSKSKSKSKKRKSKSKSRRRRKSKGKSRRRRKSKSKSRRRRRKLRFGSPMRAGTGFGGMGPGYSGATSFENGFAPYFGGKEPFIQASEWWYSNPGSHGQLMGKEAGGTHFQSPKMVGMYKK